MAQLPRALQKIFGSTGAASEFGKIGSKAAGAPVTTKDLELMQSLSEYLLGLNAIVSDQGTSVLPYLEDINSLFFLTTSQIAYLFQSGIPEWDDETEYYLDVSLVVEGGITYKDIFGIGGTPNLNFQPSANPTKWEAVLGLRAVDFESKDLIINVQTADTVMAWFTRLSLLDSNYIPKYLNDKALTWDITTPGVLEPGTTRKPSTPYGMWVDSAENLVLAPDLIGAADSFTLNELRDSGASFLTDLVHEDDVVYNLDSKLKTTAASDSVAEGIVVLNDNIFPLGTENYKIVKMSPVGLGANRERIGTVENNSGDVLDNSWYTQIQEEKKYSEAAGDFTASAANWTTDFADIAVNQVNDWTGSGNWITETNARGSFSTGTVSNFIIAISGIISSAKEQYMGITDRSIGTRGANEESAAVVPASSGNLQALFASSISIANAWLFQGKTKLSKKPSFHL